MKPTLAIGRTLLEGFEGSLSRVASHRWPRLRTTPDMIPGRQSASRSGCTGLRDRHSTDITPWWTPCRRTGARTGSRRSAGSASAHRGSGVTRALRASASSESPESTVADGLRWPSRARTPCRRPSAGSCPWPRISVPAASTWRAAASASVTGSAWRPGPRNGAERCARRRSLRKRPGSTPMLVAARS